MREYASRLSLLAAVVAAGVALSACGGGYDVEFKGGVFDAMGLNDIKGRKEPKMASRAGLVIPPSTASLPPPGTRQQAAVAPGGEAFPVNPEDRKKQDTAEIVKRHEAFCEKARLRFEQGIDQTLESSPWGACHQSILRNLTGRDLSGKKAVGAQ